MPRVFRLRRGRITSAALRRSCRALRRENRACHAGLWLLKRCVDIGSQTYVGKDPTTAILENQGCSAALTHDVHGMNGQDHGPGAPLLEYFALAFFLEAMVSH